MQLINGGFACDSPEFANKRCKQTGLLLSKLYCENRKAIVHVTSNPFRVIIKPEHRHYLTRLVVN